MPCPVLEIHDLSARTDSSLLLASKFLKNRGRSLNLPGSTCVK